MTRSLDRQREQEMGQTAGGGWGRPRLPRGQELHRPRPGLGWAARVGKAQCGKGKGPPWPQSHIAGELLILLHQLLVLLIHGQHLADPVGGCLGLWQE